jgi:transcription-repair coupling factor (superfamily II helicase)
LTANGGTGTLPALVVSAPHGLGGELLQAATKTPAVQELRRRMENGGVLSCAGVSAAAQPFLAVVLRTFFPDRPIILVADNLKAQEGMFQDVQTWLRLLRDRQEMRHDPVTPSFSPSDGERVPGGRVSADSVVDSSDFSASLLSQLLFYPAWEILPHETRLPHADVISERLETLEALQRHEHRAPLIVTSVIALQQRTLAPDGLRAHTRILECGCRCDPLDLVEWLEAQSYEPEVQVTQKGEMALRGGILDVYPPTSPWPIRLEFFGDELESMRQFDPHSQISKDAISKVTLPPAGELSLLRRTTDPHPPATFLDHLPPHAIFVLCEPESLAAASDQYSVQVPALDPLFVSWPMFLQELSARGLTRLDVAELGALSIQPPIVPNGESAAAMRAHPAPGVESASPADLASFVERHHLPDAFELPMPSLELYRPVRDRVTDAQVLEQQRRDFFQQVHRWLRQGYAVHVLCNNEGERQRFLEVWQEYGFDPDPADADERRSGRAAEPVLHLGALTRGFLFEAARLVVVTDAEVFGRYKIQRPRRLKSPHATAARSALEIDFTDLDDGDYVVHVQHGIGRYLGLSALPAASGRLPSVASVSGHIPAGQECLVIEYAPREPGQAAPKLYVPVSESHLVSKYVGAGKARPPLNRLGGTRWAKAKAQAETAIRDFAAELLTIQAARESQAGHAFPPDSPWQREFESAFVYEETPDQVRAIAETKTDLESSRPMDRLICGDVGFGKTEVAIRAAFKAVMGGRQVAILVPTTVLAQQHYNTFVERMADYPIRVELLSRFRTRPQQQRVVRDLATGAVDIVIGTHRLVQPDILFKDLGLVVIDEEQRFGVAHKETFKRMRHLVDVLTLSATPIPRTLYLALTGARDMSTIETPPQDRLPVETIVGPYDERTIRDAIQRELNRGGQVFFLHNRVTTIDTVARRLLELIPQARLVIGHGQMHSDELEAVMTRFVNGEADVLLSTTIIESGIDIPNANTIIIDRADRFGLSDLYQLRGRVGRYKHQAYAYFLLPRHAGILADARKRIGAIKQYSSLGSGFKIAMRDLEIRGAGNLLGPEQSGQITAVGFELYCQLLQQSVSALKGETVARRIDVQFRIDFLALNPGEGIEDEREQKPEGRGQKPGGKGQRTEDRRRRTVGGGRTGKRGEDAGATGSSDLLATSSATTPRAPAYLPARYVPEARHRIEMYRKLAQARDRSALDQLRGEIRDRFGPLPPAVERLLQLGELKIMAAERGVSLIETRDDRLMLTRHGDFVMWGGKFPRLTQKDADGRLKEIQRVVRAL